MQRFQPEAIVCQCGADSLASDPLGTFNMTPAAYAGCISTIQSYKLPSLYLGGGGYHKANASRCFTTILAGLIGVSLPSDIPEHDVIIDFLKMKSCTLIFHFIMQQFFGCYGPSFEIDVSRGLRRDENSPEYIQSLLQQVLGMSIYTRDERN